MILALFPILERTTQNCLFGRMNQIVLNRFMRLSVSFQSLWHDIKDPIHNNSKAYPLFSYY